jgi:transcriptional regulator with GAF, ATPase, and Fis domain
LFESEFFGHVKGAFTGAIIDRTGRFELADGGTLFLDEVGEIPLELQSKLLRVLQEQQFERVGDSKTRRVDVRIIAATNRDLKQAVVNGEFREDLYFRLNVFPVESAPLRERPEDIPLLASHFLKLAGTRSGKQDLHFTVGDIQRMQVYPWPGNIRELINFIERSVILARGGRLSVDLPEIAAVERPGTALSKRSVQPDTDVFTEADRKHSDRNNIIAALRACNGKVFGQDGAAQLMGIKPTTLSSRIKRYRIDRYRFKA